MIESTMRVTFEPVSFDVIDGAVRAHLAALPSLVDSFVEEHLRDSNHYRLLLQGDDAGFGSIHGHSLITQFVMHDPFRLHGQACYLKLRKLEQVQAAMAPTCDEFYLVHAIDDAQKIEKQGYLFRSLPDQMKSALGPWWTLEPVTMNDVDFVREHSGDFFEPFERYIEPGGLFWVNRRGVCGAFGVLEQSGLYNDVGSIGMFTIEACRRSGYGTATITLLREECQKRGLRAIGGCWYYNHASKRTLERAGMVATSRLLRITY